MKCAACGGEIVEDSHGSESTLVCSECGDIGQITDGTNFEFSRVGLVSKQDLSHAQQLEGQFHRSLDDPAVQLGKRLEKYRTKIVKAVRRFTHDVDVADAAFQTFSNLCREKVFDSWRVNKMRLSGVCLFIACRERGVSVTVDCICQAMEIPRKGFHKICKKVRDKTGTSFISVQSVSRIIEQLPIFQSRPDLLKKTAKLRELFTTCSLGDGRSSPVIAHAIAYFTVVSEETSKKTCTPYSQFCRQNDIDHISNPMILEFKQRLILLVKRLPWMSSQAVRIHSIHTYINDVLKHKDGLLGLDEANGSEPLHVSIKPSVVGESDVTGSLTSKTSLVLKGERDMIENKLTLKQYMNLSPCFIKSAQKPRTAFTADLTLPTVSCSETLDDSDLPDEEIKEYLRDPEEVEKNIRIRRLLRDRYEAASPDGT